MTEASIPSRGAKWDDLEAFQGYVHKYYTDDVTLHELAGCWVPTGTGDMSLAMRPLMDALIAWIAPRDAAMVGDEDSDEGMRTLDSYTLEPCRHQTPGACWRPSHSSVTIHRVQ